MMDWQPGDVALCVDDTAPEGAERPWKLKAGNHYTVVRVGIYVFGQFYEKRRYALELLEIKRPYSHSAFGASRFQKQPPLIKETEEEKEAAL